MTFFLMSPTSELVHNNVNRNQYYTTPSLLLVSTFLAYKLYFTEKTQCHDKFVLHSLY